MAHMRRWCVGALAISGVWAVLPACNGIIDVEKYSFGGNGGNSSGKGGQDAIGGQGGAGLASGGSGGTGAGSAYCGDGIVDPGEECDGPALDGAACADFAHDKGALKCDATCHFDTSGCCDNECAGPSGTQECASSNTVHVCGQHDADECLEWGTAQQCPMTCVDGQCACSTDAECVMQQDQCHESQGSCIGGKCSYEPKPSGTLCDDGSKCTQLDTCQNGTCVGGDPVACTALDQCHVSGTCDGATGQCSNPNAPSNTPCNDSNACTLIDSCQAGTCVGSNQVVCQPQDQCHVAGTCDKATGQCSNPSAANGTACNDANACTQVDSCQSGACVGANQVVCQAQDQCHVAGTCDPTTGQCSNPTVANGTACNDANACTQVDLCQGGACTGTNAITCGASDQCHVAGTCNPATGQCSNPNAVNGTQCNDGNGCTSGETCQNGLCSGGSVLACNSPPNTQCYNQTGTCSGGTCSYTPKAYGTNCNDGDSCSSADICNGSGTCMGTAIQCNSPPNQCYNSTGACSMGTCSYTYKTSGSLCNDGNSCTQGDVCNGFGSCGGTTISCNSPPNTQCYNQAGSCSGGSCSYTPKSFGTSCSDGDSCTAGDICNGSGSCSGTTIQCNNPPGECWNSSGTCSGGSCQYSQKTTGTGCSTGVCQSGSCVTCLNGQTQNSSCNIPGYCPPGTQTRTCSNGQWGSYGQCSASSSYRYCGDGSKYCGAVICIQMSSSCSSSTATAVISKADGSKFTNNADVTIYSPTTGQSLQFGCLATANQYSTTVQFNPSQLGLNTVGSTISVNAQLFSPCVGGATYISANGYVSRCSN